MIVVKGIPEPVVDHLVEQICLGHAHAIAIAGLGEQERCLIHVFDASGQDDLGTPHDNLMGCRDDGLQARATDAVERHAGDTVGQTGLQGHLPSRVHPLACL